MAKTKRARVSIPTEAWDKPLRYVQRVLKENTTSSIQLGKNMGLPASTIRSLRAGGTQSIDLNTLKIVLQFNGDIK